MTFYIDYDNQRYLTSDGAVTPLTPSLIYGSVPSMTFSFRTAANAAVNLTAAVNWKAAVDVDYDHDSDPMIRVLNDSITSTSSASGLITVALDTRTAEYLAAVGTNPKVSALLEILGMDASDNVVHSVIVPITARNSVDPAGGLPSTVIPANYETTYADAPTPDPTAASKIYYIDFENEKWTDSQGASVATPSISYSTCGQYKFLFKTWLTGTYSAVDASDCVTWHIAAHTSFGATTPMVRALDCNINHESGVYGQLCAVLDSRNSVFQGQVNGVASKAGYLQILGFNGDALPVVSVILPIIAKGSVDPLGGTPSGVVGNFYTKSENDAYIARVDNDIADVSGHTTTLLSDNNHVSITSATWDTAYATLQANSAGWESTQSTLQSNSAGWESVESTVLINSAGWEASQSTLGTNSAGWESAESTVQNNSANWSVGGNLGDEVIDLSSASADWDNVVSTVGSNSAGWESAQSTLAGNSANWESVESTVGSNSTGWESAETTVISNSATWTTAHDYASTLAANSANYVTTNTPQTITANKVFDGDLTVHGTFRATSSIIITSEIVGLSANYLTLNTNVTGTPSENGGIRVNRGLSAYSQLQWNETTDRWMGGVSSDMDNILLSSDIAAMQSNSANWQSVYNSVATTSSSWGVGGDIAADVADLAGASRNWDSARSILLSNSAGWEASQSTLQGNSAGWEAVQSTVAGNSASWTAGGALNDEVADIAAASGNWNSTRSTLASNSGDWESAQSTLTAASGDWENHIATVTGNPHAVTKTEVGLENVANLDTTNPANISQSSSYRFVTDTEKNTWNAKESAISAGTSAQYFRGDKTFQVLNQAAIAGLTVADSPTFAGLTVNGNLTQSTASGTACVHTFNHAGTANYNQIYFQEAGTGKAYIQQLGSAYASDATRRNVLEIGTLGDYPIAFRPNDALMMSVSSAGVGIGTNDPENALHVLTAGSQGVKFENTSVSGGSLLYLINSGGTAKTTILGQYGSGHALAGKFCISVDGGTTQQAILDTTGLTVAGKVITTCSGNDTFGIQVLKSGGAVTIGGIYQATAGDGMIVAYKADGTENVRFHSNGDSFLKGGNFGINESSPGVKLTVKSPGSGAPVTSGTTQTYGALRLNDDSNAVVDFGVNGSSGAWIQVTDKSNLTPGNSYPLLLQPNGGLVGIGTASPTFRLQVEGAAAANSEIFAAYSTNMNGFYMKRNAANDAHIYSFENGNTIFGGPAPTHRLTVVSSTSPQVRISNSTSNQGMYLGSSSANGGYVSAGCDIASSSWYARATSASVFEQSSGAFKWYSNSDLTAGNSFTLTLRMELQANGNLWIFNSDSGPATPATGGVLYVDSGALKYKGSSGTVTTIAPA